MGLCMRSRGHHVMAVPASFHYRHDMRHSRHRCGMRVVVVVVILVRYGQRQEKHACTCTSSSSQSGGVLQQLPRCGIAHSSSLSSAGLASHARASPLATAHASVPVPSIILTLPFHSEFQIPQNGIPHSNFLSHSKVEPLAPNTNIKSTTGYWAPVRIRSAAWSSASPDGRVVG